MDRVPECQSDVVFALDENGEERHTANPEKATDANEGKELGRLTCDGSPLGTSSAGTFSPRSLFFSTPPRKGMFLELIDCILRFGTSSPVLQAVNKPMDDGSPLSADDEARRFFTTEVVDQLCDEVRAVLEMERTLVNLQLKEQETLVVVGDIHGDLNVLLSHILPEQSDKEINVDGLDRKFLFLGDYVDRGPYGVEVVMLLFALKVEYPQLIHIMRGNHEEPQTSRIYGFYSEVNLKFGCDSPWIRFNEMFCYLPLAAVVTTPRIRFFATHGGLSPPLSETFDIVNTIERIDYGSVLDNVLSEVVDGLLWSDPTEVIPYFERNVRGCGYMFGIRATQEFCRENQFDFICRAHQVVAQGYSWSHEKKVLTLFSVPNYCGFNNNLGAIMIVHVSGAGQKEEEELRFRQFSSAMGSNACSPQTPKPCGEFVFAGFME
ncbi:phosphoprotein phosphatase, putative [Trypanosoma cruzi marinkellei]|uniref:Serine/threonine-protein phosphatase n=1 Tax=Trypanosoma cruzi marinkellei TaxID=85056 RepID=K2MDZ3_TRYCR|nr:phosphoprotein phosphatase, putative [Trypanosoma cruzi marinkellei]